MLEIGEVGQGRALLAADQAGFWEEAVITCAAIHGPAEMVRDFGGSDHPQIAQITQNKTMLQKGTRSTK